MRIPIDRIKPNPWNPNILFQDKRERLKNLMMASGPEGVPPIIVRPSVNGLYEIIDGEQRWLIARELGWEDIPAVVLELSDEEAKAMTLSCNYLKGEVNFAKLARLARADKQIIDAVKKVFGRKYAEAIEKLSQCPDSYLNKLEEKILSGKTLSWDDVAAAMQSPTPQTSLGVLLYMRDMAVNHSNVLSPQPQEEIEARAEKKRREEGLREYFEPFKAEAAEEEEENFVESGGIFFEEEEEISEEAAKRLTSLPPGEALKELKAIEPEAEAAMYYRCDCGRVHALYQKNGKLNAYKVTETGQALSYKRLESKVTAWIILCPKCRLRMLIDAETGEVTPDLGEADEDEQGNRQG